MSTTAEKLQFSEMRAAEIERLYNKYGSGLTAAQLAQTREKPRNLYTAPYTFQPRQGDAEWEMKAHIRELVRAGGREGEAGLAPILLFAVAGTRLVVDGHCRLDAYRKLDPTGRKEIPVRYLNNKYDFPAAVLQAAACNSKNKLALSSRAKAESAWKYIQFEEGKAVVHSLRDIEQATGCSKSQVGLMRTLLRDHPKTTKAGAPAWNPRDLSWAEAKLGQRTKEEFDVDAWREKKIIRWATQMRKACGATPDQQPDLFLEAIQRAYPCLAKGIAEEAASAIEEIERATEGELTDF